MNGFTEFVKALGVGRIAALAATLAAMMGFFLFLILRLSASPMAPLYGHLESTDAGTIINRLESLKIPYELKGDGTLILVPEDRVLRLRMSLAEEGLPSRSSAGYELFDKQDAFGSTSFVQNINHLRALEGELARTIQSIDSIEAARVHLVLPKRELFAKDPAQASASIAVKARATLSPGQVKAIQNLVASAVEGLQTDHVAIIDEHGRLLAGAANGDPQQQASAALEDRTAAFEQRLKTQVEDIVSSVVGPNRARVEVATELDFNRVTESSESFDPDGQVVRSTQTVQETSNNSEGQPQNSVSIASNLPESKDAPKSESSTNKSATDRNEETVNYEISRITKTAVLEAGRVKRLSVAVLVDGNRETGAKGEKTYAARSQEELDKIGTLVQSAIGYDQKRGDQVSVVNLPFAAGETIQDVPEKEPLLSLTKSDYMRIGEAIALIAVTLLMALFVFRPMIHRLTGVARGQGGAAPGTPALPGMTQQQIAGPTGSMPALAMASPSSSGSTNEHALPARIPMPMLPQSMIDIAQVEGQVKESSVRKVGEIIGNHPDEAMSILRNWMYQGE